MTNTGVCSRSARSKAAAPNLKASAGSSGNSSTCLVSPCEAYAQEMMSVCCVRVSVPDQGSGALHVEDHRRNFGEIGEPEKLLHQRDARARGGRERPRAVPGGADHHADRGEFVLGLHDGEFVLLGGGVDAHALAVAGESLGQRRRRCDRIPGADRGAAIDRAERGGRIAFDENAVADPVGAPEAAIRSGVRHSSSPSRGRDAMHACWRRNSFSLPLNCSPISLSISPTSISSRADSAPT